MELSTGKTLGNDSKGISKKDLQLMIKAAEKKKE